MHTSEQTNELYTALIDARSTLTNPDLDAKGEYPYLSLSHLIDLVMPALTHAGLTVVQGVEDTDAGAVAISTRIVHESGQWIESRFSLPPAALQGGAGKNPVQQLGASITYGRRYGLQAILSVCGDKDTDAAGYGAPPKSQRENLITDLHRAGKARYGDDWKAQGPDLLEEVTGKRSTDDLDRADLVRVIRRLEDRAPDAPGDADLFPEEKETD